MSASAMCGRVYVRMPLSDVEERMLANLASVGPPMPKFYCQRLEGHGGSHCCGHINPSEPLRVMVWDDEEEWFYGPGVSSSGPHRLSDSDRPKPIWPAHL